MLIQTFLFFDPLIYNLLPTEMHARADSFGKYDMQINNIFVRQVESRQKIPDISKLKISLIRLLNEALQNLDKKN